jgi:PKHD-type hydroxylase
MDHLIDISFNHSNNNLSNETPPDNNYEKTEMNTLLHGGGFLLNQGPETPVSLWIDGAFTNAQIELIKTVSFTLPPIVSETEGGKTAYRTSTQRMLYPSRDFDWLFSKLRDVVHTANTYYGYDLFGMLEGVQITTYHAPNSHYDWHVDIGANVPTRKLSLCMQLSDPSEYEGGELQVWRGGDPLIEEKKKGRITVFPSWTMHRVTPVTSGVRHSLVCWVTGTPFK